jgi:ATP-dependent Clp protease adapter protein ClpS
VVVKAAPTAAFVVSWPDLLLEFEIVALDPPAEFGMIDHALERDVGRQRGEPREFVVTVLKAEFRMSEDQALRVMMTAHRRGLCVVAVITKDVAEARATNASDAGRRKGYPLLFTTEPEE